MKSKRFALSDNVAYEAKRIVQVDVKVSCAKYYRSQGDDMISEQTIRQAAQLLGEAAKPARVILFGSYARGDAGEASDLDFLVVEPTLRDKFNEMVRLRQVLRPLNVPADVLVCSQAEANQQQHASSTAIYWALREGKVLYDTAQ